VQSTPSRTAHHIERISIYNGAFQSYSVKRRSLEIGQPTGRLFGEGADHGENSPLPTTNRTSRIIATESSERFGWIAGYSEIGSFR
jgi:hypothetical protein